MWWQREEVWEVFVVREQLGHAQQQRRDYGKNLVAIHFAQMEVQEAAGEDPNPS